MNKQLLTVVSSLVLAATGLPAQGGRSGSMPAGVVQPGQFPTISNFQQINVIAAQPSLGGRGAGSGAVVTGSPLSAKEVRKTVQTLGDGTQIENAETSLVYRDSQGRTRTESRDGAAISILDPVGSFRLQLNSASKMAIRIPVPAALMPVAPMVTRPPAASENSRPTIEDLGFQPQNGVMAQGTRTTMIIPQGQIGNNREIRIVNERWFSKDLQMLVKTVNSDPRFGVTTYDLTDIVQADPDASLFQVPAGYTLSEGGGGRGGPRGGGR